MGLGDKKMRYFRLIILLTFAFTTFVKAEDITEEYAKMIALNTFEMNHPELKRSVLKTVKIPYKTIFVYVVGFKEGGYCVVSGNKNSEPVPMYSLSTHIDSTEVKLEIKLGILLENVYKNSLINERATEEKYYWESIEKKDPNIKLKVKKKTQKSAFILNKRIKTRWLQYSTDYTYGGDYNALCPLVPNQATSDPNDQIKAVAGCVALAVAQIAKYYEHPKTVMHLQPYSVTGSNFAAGQLPNNENNIAIKYNEIPETYYDARAEKDGPMLAKLIVAAGISVKSKYASNATKPDFLSLTDFVNNIEKAINLNFEFWNTNAIRYDAVQNNYDRFFDKVSYYLREHSAPVLVNYQYDSNSGHMGIIEGYDQDDRFRVILGHFQGLWNNGNLDIEYLAKSMFNDQCFAIAVSRPTSVTLPYLYTTALGNQSSKQVALLWSKAKSSYDNIVIKGYNIYRKLSLQNKENWAKVNTFLLPYYAWQETITGYDDQENKLYKTKYDYCIGVEYDSLNIPCEVLSYPITRMLNDQEVSGLTKIGTKSTITVQGDYLDDSWEMDKVQSTSIVTDAEAHDDTDGIKNFDECVIYNSHPKDASDPPTLAINPQNFDIAWNETQSKTVTITTTGTKVKVEKIGTNVGWLNMPTSQEITVNNGSCSFSFNATENAPPSLANRPAKILVTAFSSSGGNKSGYIDIKQSFNNYADDDHLPDTWEMQYFGNLEQNDGGDPDVDHASNLLEYQKGKKPNDPNSIPEEIDYDNDRLPDYWEYIYFPHPANQNNLTFLPKDGDQEHGDYDGDGATDYMEFIANTSPINASSVPVFIDSDADLMDDRWEIKYFGTLDSTATGDPDGDHATNLQEYTYRTHPCDRNSIPGDVDHDQDGIKDWWEYKYFHYPENQNNLGFLPKDGDILEGDYDGDHVTDIREFIAGTSPIDRNNLPTNFDYDQDGIYDINEYKYFPYPQYTNSLVYLKAGQDYDLDQFNDEIEIQRGSDPKNQNDYPPSGVIVIHSPLSKPTDGRDRLNISEIGKEFDITYFSEYTHGNKPAKMFIQAYDSYNTNIDEDHVADWIQLDKKEVEACDYSTSAAFNNASKFKIKVLPNFAGVAREGAIVFSVTKDNNNYHFAGCVKNRFGSSTELYDKDVTIYVTQKGNLVNIYTPEEGGTLQTTFLACDTISIARSSYYKAVAKSKFTAGKMIDINPGFETSGESEFNITPTISHETIPDIDDRLFGSKMEWAFMFGRPFEWYIQNYHKPTHEQGNIYNLHSRTYCNEVSFAIPILS